MGSFVHFGASTILFAHAVKSSRKSSWRTSALKRRSTQPRKPTPCTRPDMRHRCLAVDRPYHPRVQRNSQSTAQSLGTYVPLLREGGSGTWLQRRSFCSILGINSPPFSEREGTFGPAELLICILSCTTIGLSVPLDAPGSTSILAGIPEIPLLLGGREFRVGWRQSNECLQACCCEG